MNRLPVSFACSLAQGVTVNQPRGLLFFGFVSEFLAEESASADCQCCEYSGKRLTVRILRIPILGRHGVRVELSIVDHYAADEEYISGQECSGMYGVRDSRCR